MDDWTVRTVIAAAVVAAGAFGAARAARADREARGGELAGFRLRVERSRLLVRTARWRGRIPGSTAEALIARLDELGRDLATAVRE